MRCGIHSRWKPSGTPIPSCANGSSDPGLDMDASIGRRRSGTGAGTASAARPALDLDAVRDRGGDQGHRVVDRHAVALLAVAVTERDRPGRHVIIPGEQHERDLLALRRPDLLLHPVVARVHLYPDPLLPQPGGDLVQVERKT